MGKFEELYQLNVNDKTEKKDGLTYLSWSWAWAEFKKVYPDATYDIIKNEDFKCYFGDEEIGYMVYTSVFAGGVRHEMCLPVMDGANKSMKRKPYTYEVKNKNFKYATLNQNDGKYYDKYGNEQTEFLTKKVDAISMFDVNKTIMRCLTKNLAMFGLGLYIYAGEDLPENESVDQEQGEEKQLKKEPKKQVKTEEKKEPFKPITKSELVQIWGVKNAEATVTWLEGRFGCELSNFDEDQATYARQLLAEKKKKREDEERRQRTLEKISGEDLPFELGERVE